MRQNKGQGGNEPPKKKGRSDVAGVDRAQDQDDEEKEEGKELATYSSKEVDE